MSRPLQILLAAAALALLAVLGRYAMERERRRNELQARGRNPFEALRRGEAAGDGEGAAMRAPGGGPSLPPLPVKWTELPPAVTGVDFVHTWGGGTMDNLVKASGGGLAAFDYDGDGDLDLYFVQGARDPVASPGGEAPPTPPRNRLFRNDGGWRFTDATEASGLGDTGFGMGAVPADYDGDGDLDLFVYGYGPDRLYRNDGGRFTDVTAAAGIEGSGFTAGAAWGDADGDGILDLLVVGYVVFDPAVKPPGPSDPFPGPLSYRGEPTRLLLGRADGTFRDGTREGGMFTTSGRGMAGAVADLDGDGIPELFVSNDATANFVYRRRADGGWTEAGFLLGLALSDLGQARSSMGVALLDADGDGRPDLVVPDGSGGAFYRNLGGRFEDRAGASGMDGAMRGRTGWSAAPLDYDLDGLPDLVITCGALHALLPQRPVLFRNGGGGVLVDRSEATSFGREATGRGCVAADFDGDGDPDVVIATLGAGPLLLRNDGGEARRSLEVRCVGRGRNRDALGATVEVEAGGRTQRAWVGTSQGYVSGVGPGLLFGLGGAARADRVRVVFPSGEVRERREVPAGRIEIRE